ncbi:unnamed protein product [Caenorhabditis auriculariae]|uniref:CX domain-containing protein n=1 Tax=Caenorhabditis auriculariae TaxID=2777116 RepID=A0A8S1HA33_9PELO|nr:unnamed protein product [Caenorhabditis auriculariae]
MNWPPSTRQVILDVNAPYTYAYRTYFWSPDTLQQHLNDTTPVSCTFIIPNEVNFFNITFLDGSTPKSASFACPKGMECCSWTCCHSFNWYSFGLLILFSLLLLVLIVAKARSYFKNRDRRKISNEPKTHRMQQVVMATEASMFPPEEATQNSFVM